MSLEIKYVPLSFMSTDDAVLYQIKNTILFSYLFQEYEETSLKYYLESTQYGYTASAAKTGTHRLVRITDINHGTVNWNTVPFCNCDTEEKYLLNSDDILVARTGGTTGKSFIVDSAPNNTVFASYLIRLRLTSETNLDFINLFLNSYAYWTQIVEMKSGSAMPNVNAEKLKTLRIPKLDFDEQSRIVTEFQKGKKNNFGYQISTKVYELESVFINSRQIDTQLTRQLNLVKQLRQAFLREAMQGKLAPQVTNDEPASVLLEKIKAEKERLVRDKKIKKQKPLPPITEDEIPFEIPEDWVWCRLREISVIGTGATPLTSNDAYYKNGTIPWITSSATNNLFVESPEQYITEKALKETNCKIYPAGTLVVAMYGQGKTRGQVTELMFSAATNQACATITLHMNDFFLRKFVKLFFQKIYLEIRELAQGGAQPNLNMSKVSNTIIPLPPLAEQQRIVAKLDELMQYCDKLEASIKESQSQNELLLQQVLREALEPKT